MTGSNSQVQHNRHYLDDEGYREIAIQAPNGAGGTCVPASVVLQFPTVDGMQDANASLIAAAPELYDALEPFADVDGEGAEDFPDDARVTVTFGRTTHYALTLGDFRRARAALAKAAPHTVADRQNGTSNTDEAKSIPSALAGERG